MPHTPISRRRFLQTSAAAGAALATASSLSRAAGVPTTLPWQGATRDQLNVAIIGVAGRGGDHVREFKHIPQSRVVALCDVDTRSLASAAKVHPDATHYVDFREMLANHPRIDAVVVATPDHTHAVATAAALRAGKHVYCEKPLTHTVHEARTIAKLAEETKLVTQIGTQIHSGDNYRRVVETIKSGAIGPVREVHIWNVRGLPAADVAPTEPPKELNYDLWLGPVAPRPFHPTFHTFGWRRWWAFGSGLLGDIFCHFADVAFWSLDLAYPTKVSTQGAPRSDEVCPEWTIVEYDFPARGSLAPVKLSWYDPPALPTAYGRWNLDPKYKEGVMFVGEDGLLFTHYFEHVLLPTDKFKSYKPPKPTIPNSVGHQHEFVMACLKNDPTMATAPFSYGALMTESALLGCVSFKANKPLEWDAAKMKITNAPDAEKFLKIDYRPGWTL